MTLHDRERSKRIRVLIQCGAAAKDVARDERVTLGAVYRVARREFQERHGHRDARIVEALARRLPHAIVSRETGCSIYLVRKLAAEWPFVGPIYQAPRPPRESRTPPWLLARRERARANREAKSCRDDAIFALRSEGLTYPQIARRLGCSRSTVEHRVNGTPYYGPDAPRRICLRALEQDTYAAWTALRIVAWDAKYEPHGILCRCACGREKVISAPLLVRGLTTRCRKCASQEIARRPRPKKS